MKEEATYGHLFIATFSILKGDKAHMIDWQYLSLGDFFFQNQILRSFNLGI